MKLNLAIASVASAFSLVSIAHAENPQRLQDCRTVIKYAGKTCDFSNTDCSVVTIPKNVSLSSIETCNKSLIDGDTKGADALCDGQAFDCKSSIPTPEPTVAPTNGATLVKPLFTLTPVLISYALMR